MGAPSQHISLRINEEDLMLIDAKIGQLGARNRSDVVRLAIQEYLRGQPKLPDMDTIKIALGRRDKMHLEMLYELEGTSKEQAALEGLKLYIKESVARAEETLLLEKALEESRALTLKSQEYQE
ncbi:MAG: ribbon-helix-helix domain-containing protein [Candidatus Thermoplasmatota archaeon]|nr:ribbon-helix-helix domain-containing protein [Candidatus Thermoplasmatota archaeon]DAC51843.1 MAG TPA: ribbon-helix-helix protein, CopG family [Candidatus Poseidoniales archaeon]DAC60814.1 MAG TPA: ribbon-helix-helix protein, CopG family [Candidatus Poseidoniales archaeon]HII23860.1 ribbon-helix-helix protein, CopG family [Candidatus Poseidoniaceae archaeon]HII50016.1 ribbon-helix-helix protein, CopG family [Candidatus Poseidoniaceae archaeon]|tara:strand:+ start:454 stop:825 length:372 start_codon:yes stop_codon:yes gene_type:complete